MRKGLTRRTIVASGVLALLVAGAFAVLLRAIEVQRDAARSATHSQEVLTAANTLERLLLDLETGRDAARGELPSASDRLVRVAASDPGQERQARAIATGVESYVQGRQPVEALRREFDRFIGAERALLARRTDSANADTRRAVVVAAIGLAGSILLVAAFAAYMMTAVALPVRRAAAMAARLAGGDLSVRMQETGVGEIGTLERSFNAMASSLEAGHAELAASRARVVATADETRRRIERDLHDGAQQSLTHTVITLKLARRSLDGGEDPAVGLVDEALGHAERATGELRDLAHGILPAVLSRGGLDAGVDTLVSRLRIPVDADVTAARFSPTLEATAYFVVAEALTNVVKHAHATSAAVRAEVEDGVLEVEIRDDGIGGARAAGSGLLGLSDRAAALDGRLTVESPPGGGTIVRATLPVGG